MRLPSLFDNEKEEEKQRAVITMEKRLQEAAMKGSVKTLLELLHQDPQILNKTTQSPSDTPLHVASLLGHSAFARELLSRKPELVAALNSQGYSPLHLAAAKASLEIVKTLVLVNPDLCFVRDRDGRIPLHLGAIKGKVGVLAELIRVRPDSARVLTPGGESGFHLCVKYNRLEALKILVEYLGKDDESVNLRDSDGNTALHVAVSKKQLEVYILFWENIFGGIQLLAHSDRKLFGFIGCVIKPLSVLKREIIEGEPELSDLLSSIDHLVRKLMSIKALLTLTY